MKLFPWSEQFSPWTLNIEHWILNIDQWTMFMVELNSKWCPEFGLVHVNGQNEVIYYWEQKASAVLVSGLQSTNLVDIKNKNDYRWMIELIVPILFTFKMLFTKQNKNRNS